MSELEISFPVDASETYRSPACCGRMLASRFESVSVVEVPKTTPKVVLLTGSLTTCADKNIKVLFKDHCTGNGGIG